MSAHRMRAADTTTDTSLVDRLVATQFPHWAGLPVRRVPSAGTANAIYRLGTGMAVRLPRSHRAALQLQKEQRWLPHLAERVPLAIPVPVEKGLPAAGYGWPWSVYQWVDGENATADRIADDRQAAADLGGFVIALRQVDATGGPPPGEHNYFRGVPLAERDSQTRFAIGSLHTTVDGRAATAAWNRALAAPAWDRSPGWIHGALQGVNLLARQGALAAVIDFGCAGVGDPACDLMVAWTFLSAENRDIFRLASRVDDATWARGRGWALSVSLVALTYRRHDNALAQRTIEAVLTDHRAA